MSPQERWQRDQDQAARLDPYSDPRVVKTRAADGITVLFDGLTKDEFLAGKQGAVTRAPEAAPVVDTSAKIKIGDVEATENEWRDALTAKAAAESKKLSLPENGNYKLELPPDLKLPNGVKFEFAENDPLKKPGLDAARAFSLKHGLDQTAFSELLGIYAGSQAHEIATLNAARDAEVQKLGAAGTARVTAVTTWIRAFFGEARARPLIATLATEAHIASYEKIIQRLTNQGGGNYSGAGRDGEEQPRLSDAQYDKMTYTEKKDYADRANQPQTSRRR
jgi:hypothetical protein